MNYKKLKKILLEYYKPNTIKHMLGIKNPIKPSYQKAELLFKNHKIPFEAWINIRAWLSKQEKRSKNDLQTSRTNKGVKNG